MKVIAMSDFAVDTSAPRAPKKQRPTAKTRPRIPTADGDFLEPRQQWAGVVGITDRSARKLNLPTVYIAGVAYVPHRRSTEILVDRAQRRNEPAPHRRPGRKPTAG
jgi:hypothetical protein